MAQGKPTMTREHLLAAEIYGYSFANYQNHLGIGNVRYEQYMPECAAVLERATRESWPLAKVAEELETDEPNARDLLDAYERATAVIDPQNPAEGFRNAVRFAVHDAVAEGLAADAAIEKLVTQICYRTADLAYVLEQRGESLSRYSRHLRREQGVEYYEGYFDERDA